MSPLQGCRGDIIPSVSNTVHLNLKAETYVAWSLGWPVPPVCVSAGVWAGGLHGDREAREQKEEKRESQWRQRWRAELSERPRRLLLAPAQESVCCVHVGNHAREPKGSWTCALWRHIHPLISPFFHVFFFFFLKLGGGTSWAASSV